MPCTELSAPVHKVQLLTYLKLSGHRLGLLIDFNVPTIKSTGSRAWPSDDVLLDLCPPWCLGVVCGVRVFTPARLAVWGSTFLY